MNKSGGGGGREGGTMTNTDDRISTCHKKIIMICVCVCCCSCGCGSREPRPCGSHGRVGALAMCEPTSPVLKHEEEREHNLALHSGRRNSAGTA